MDSSSELPTPRRPAWLLGATLCVVGHLGLLATFDLAARPFLTAAFAALGFIGVLLATRVAGSTRIPAAALLVVAALLRVLLIPLPPTLSDDLLRYAWDGRVALSGANPYALQPLDPRLESLRDEMWDRMAHKDVATVYPPLALTVFSIASAFPRPLLALKLMLALADLATCALLIGLATTLGLPRSRVAWYAWNPLVTIEGAGMGHVDILGVLAVVATVAYLVSRPPRPVRAAVTAAAGILAKLVPLVALPLWARASGRRWLFLSVTLAIILGVLAPLPLASGGLPPGFTRYGVSWEFNGPLFEPLWRLLDLAGLSTWIKVGLDGLKAVFGHHDFWNRLYPFVYPQLLAKLLLLPGILIAMVKATRMRKVTAATGFVFSSVILFSATVYPWYLLWMLPFAALCLQPAWLALSALVLLSYVPQIYPVTLFPLVWAAIWLPFAFLLVRYPQWSTD